MNTWIIEPHDSFIARDGRPFGLVAGVRASSLPFPFPSTTTGGVRTREGLTALGVFDPRQLAHVKGLEVRGALLVSVDMDRGVTQWFAAAPADAVLFDSKESDKEKANDKAAVCRLIARDLSASAATNLPDADLMPLYLESNQGKPHGYPPRFWRWDEFRKWLEDPKGFDIDSLYDFGIATLPKDQRSHVGIERESQANEQGSLFQTRGLEFTRQKRKVGDTMLHESIRLALAVSTDAAKINEGTASLGGERRLVHWRRFTGSENILDSRCPGNIADRIIKDKACRVLLLTPAWFEHGWRPKWMTDDKAEIDGDLTVKLKAAAIGRPEVVSGWDFEYIGREEGKIVYGRPKPTRRLVPSGSVFFLKFSEDENEIINWINKIWMRCVSDIDERNGMTPRKDGFGLAVLGVWPEGKDVK